MLPPAFSGKARCTTWGRGSSRRTSRLCDRSQRGGARRPHTLPGLPRP